MITKRIRPREPQFTALRAVSSPFEAKVQQVLVAYRAEYGQNLNEPDIRIVFYFACGDFTSHSKTGAVLVPLRA